MLVKREEEEGKEEEKKKPTSHQNKEHASWLMVALQCFLAEGHGCRYESQWIWFGRNMVDHYTLSSQKC